MKRWLVTVLLVSVAAWLAGCETMQGLGRDISKAGEKIEGAAQK